MFNPFRNGRFQQQLTADQNSALKPDTKTPFRSKRDAVQRLLRYHVYQKPSPPPEVLEKSKFHIFLKRCFGLKII